MKKLGFVALLCMVFHGMMFAENLKCAAGAGYKKPLMEVIAAFEA